MKYATHYNEINKIFYEEDENYINVWEDELAYSVVKIFKDKRDNAFWKITGYENERGGRDLSDMEPTEIKTVVTSYWGDKKEESKEELVDQLEKSIKYSLSIVKKLRDEKGFYLSDVSLQEVLSDIETWRTKKQP